MRSGIIYGDNVVVAIDYYPPSGASYPALNKIAKDGTFNEWKLSQGHGGANFVILRCQKQSFFTCLSSCGYQYAARHNRQGSQIKLYLRSSWQCFLRTGWKPLRVYQQRQQENAC